MDEFWVLSWGLFVLGATCYLLFITSGFLEDVGERLGKLLKLSEDVVASTFQAAATSGPEIVMAILAATPFIAGEVWQTLELGEKGCSGTLNAAFSAVDNLLGIGAVAMIFMIRMGKVDPDGAIPATPSTVIGLFFYIVAASALALFVIDGAITEMEAWLLMSIGILFVSSQLLIPSIINRYWPSEEEGYGRDEDKEDPVPQFLTEPVTWSKDLLISGFTYAFLIFALIVFVREAMGATFNIAATGLFSLGGILVLFTSYVSSFPEFMMAFRYTVADKKDELLGMLFGSNVIDLGFAGFRAMWLHETMEVYTTGRLPQFLPYFIWTLPMVAAVFLIGLSTKTMKWKHAYPLVVFYMVYKVSGFVLL